MSSLRSLIAVFVLSSAVVTAVAQELVIDVGSTNTFSATPGATNYSWRLNLGALTNVTTSTFPFTPGRKDVGTHWISVESIFSGGIVSNQHWHARVRIPLPTPGLNLYVATNGLDSNAGSLASPFLTLDRARNAIRTSGVPAGGVTVWLRGGTYRLTNSFTLTNLDSGLAGAPIVYRNYPGETPVLTTARLLDPTNFTTLSSNLWPRVAPGVTASNILELDLVALTITNRGPFPVEYLRCPIVNPYSPANDGGLFEFYFNGTRQPLSRYPNANATNRWLTSYLKMNGVIFKTATNYLGTNIGGMFYFHSNDLARIQRWTTAAAETNLWIQGFWRVPWEAEGLRILSVNTASNTITLASGATPGATGLGNKYTGPAGSSNEPYWAVNLLEEIDAPGEWSVDFFRRKLYFLPPGPLATGSVAVADTARPIILVTAATNVVFSGLTFDTGLSQGVSVLNGALNLIVGCSFQNLGSFAVDLNGGRSNGVVSCNIAQMAAGGINVRGGSETNSPRIPTDHFVVNNRITNIALVVPVYAAGIDAGFAGMGGGGGGGGHETSVGARIAHNHIQGTPHGPIIRGSFDKVFEYNRLEDYTMISGDFGGIYCYQSTNQGGYDILRFNYLYAPTNYLWPTYLNPGPNGGIGIQVDNTWVGDSMYGNIATARRSGHGAGTGGGSNGQFFNNMTVNCGAGGTDWEGFPALYATNVGALGATAFSGDVTGTNATYSSNPGFLSVTNRDLRLDPASVIYSDLPGFHEIPFELIGLYNDEYRTNAPTLRPVVRTASAPASLSTNSAVVSGSLVFPWLNPDTTVRVFWGTADGGTNAGAWTTFVDLGVKVRGDLAATLTNLTPGVPYYYRFQASNTAGVAWSTNTATFVLPRPRYQMNITFPGYTTGETLTNIPLLVTLGTNVPGFTYSTFTSPNGGDLRIYSPDGLTNLPFEIERWNTNGASHVWIRVPQLTTSATVLARWGDPLATNLPASSTDGSTWNNGYLGVWHLRETSGPHRDSSPRLATSLVTLAAAQGTATGIVAGCDNFTGAVQYVSLPSLGTYAAVTVEAWCRLNATPAASDIGLVSSDPWSPGITHFKVSSLLQLKAHLNSGGTYTSPTNTLTVTNWFHAGYTIAGTGTNQFRIYLNGLQIGATNGRSDNNLNSLRIARENNARYLNGRVDEVRISQLARSSNWMRTTFLNIASNDSFAAFGTVTNLFPLPPASLTASAADTGVILNWSASPGALSYNVKRSTTNGGPYTFVANVTSLTHTNLGLVNGTLYYFVVSAINASGEGADSPQASATPLTDSVKADNALDLDLPASWLNNTVPTGALAIWNSIVTSTGVVTIGAGAAFDGIQIVDPAVNIAILPGTNGLLALGGSGLDLSTSARTLTLGARLSLGAVQSWKTGTSGVPGSTQITVTNDVSGSGGILLDDANTRGVVFSGSNTFTGGFTLGANAIVRPAPRVASTAGATGSNGVLLSNPLGVGILTINGGAVSNANFALDAGIAHTRINVNADFAITTQDGANNGRMMIGGPLDLGGNVRTVSTFRTLNSPSLVLGAGGNISWGLGTVGTLPSSVSNGTLRIVRHPNAAGAYVAFRLRDTAFRQNAGLILGSNVVLILGNNWNPGVSNLATLTLEPGAIVALNEAASLRNISLSSLEGDGTIGNFITNASSTATLTLNSGALTGTATFAGRLINTDTNFNASSTNGTLALVKSGSHTQILTGSNSYSGPTTILGGTLLVMGDQSAATGLVTVASNAVFGGTGTVGASVTVSNGGTLYTSEFPGTFTSLGQVNLNGTTLLGIARDGFVLTNNICRASGTITYGGTLLLTNLGTAPLQVGDSFKLFDAPAYAGTFTNIVPPAGYTFTSTLELDGRITVATGLPNTAPVLNELSDQDLHIGATLNVTASATDNEAPPQVITYSLLTPPEGMTIDTNSGAITWRAPYASAGSAGVVTVVATDNGIPALSATQTFLLDVLPITTPPGISDPTWTNGAFGLTIFGDSGPDYIIQASSNMLDWTNIHVATPPSLPIQWTDADSTNFNARFYRLFVQP